MEKSTLRQHARDLRKNSTDAERHLWYHLRANRLGFKFKRQVPIGTYIVDFVCLEKRLIIELDGGQHIDNQIYDKIEFTCSLIASVDRINHRYAGVYHICSQS